jgi:hypothetical protein
MTDQLWLGRTVKELFSSDISAQLSRYEAGLWRHFSALLKEQRETHARRQYAAQGEKEQPGRARRPVRSFAVVANPHSEMLGNRAGSPVA